MNMIEALNNENSDELQKRIRLLGMSAKDCPTRKGDRVEYLGAYLLSAELHDQIALISLLRQQTESGLTVEVEDFLNGLRKPGYVLSADSTVV